MPKRVLTGMKKAIFFLGFMLSLLFGITNVFAENEVKFKNTVDQNYARVVRSLFGNLIYRTPDLILEYAVVDLQDRGVPSIFVRFISKETCVGQECKTALISFDKNKRLWKVIFQHKAQSISLGRPDKNPSSNNMKTIIIDGKARWVWSGFDHYMPDVFSLGQPFPPKNLWMRKY